MSRQDRLSRMVDYVVERGSVRVDDVVSDLGISPATARRDLDDLAAQQLLIRTRGGASANPTTGEVPLRHRTSRQPRQKEAIARHAASMIAPGDIVGFNGGTTTTAAAHELGVRIAAEPQFGARNITVVTNAVNIANDLTIREQARVVVTGGVARTRSYELVGPLAELILPSISIDTLFLGVNAIDLVGGFYTHNEDEASINAALVRASRRTVVLADSSKLGASSFALICRLDEVHALVTDEGASAEALAIVRDAGVHVILV